MKTTRVLVIAGSDSGGGAGIQADIKTITMLGGHAMTAVTAVTAQNSEGVTAIHAIPAEVVLAQIDAVVSDFGVDAVKIGMIGSAFSALHIAERLASLDGIPIVFDPVMVATSGAQLADDATVAAFGRLMDVATLTSSSSPDSRFSSGRLGVVSVASSINRSKPAIVSASAKVAALVVIITGSNTTGTARPAIRSATMAAIAGEPSIPSLMASTPMSEMQASICVATKSALSTSIVLTPSVFCAVITVIALIA